MMYNVVESVREDVGWAPLVAVVWKASRQAQTGLAAERKQAADSTGGAKISRHQPSRSNYDEACCLARRPSTHGPDITHARHTARGVSPSTVHPVQMKDPNTSNLNDDDDF